MIHVFPPHLSHAVHQASNQSLSCVCLCVSLFVWVDLNHVIKLHYRFLKMYIGQIWLRSHSEKNK